MIAEYGVTLARVPAVRPFTLAAPLALFVPVMVPVVYVIEVAGIEFGELVKFVDVTLAVHPGKERRLSVTVTAPKVSVEVVAPAPLLALEETAVVIADIESEPVGPVTTTVTGVSTAMAEFPVAATSEMKSALATKTLRLLV